MRWLGILWPVLLLMLPSVYDEPARVPSTIVRESVQDTTYADKRFVSLVPGVWSTLSGDSQFIPDPDSTGTAVSYYAVRGGDSFLVVSYDTLNVAALDSAAVDSIYTAWSLSTPAAYALNVPGTPAQSGADAYVAVDWSDFESDSALLAQRCDDATQCLFRTDSWGGTNPWIGDWSVDDDSSKLVILDTAVKPPAGTGATKSLRYDWRYTDGDCDSAQQADPVHGNICSNLGMHLTNFYVDTSVADPDPKNTTELWVEIWYRYGPNWSPCNVFDDPCAYKTVFLTFPGSNSRSSWRFGGRGEGFAGQESKGWKVGNAGAGAGLAHGPVHGDSNVRTFAVASHMDNDGNGAGYSLFTRYRDTIAAKTDTLWHVAWIYHKQGSGMTPSTATLDGEIAFWLDSVLIYDSEHDIDAGLMDPWNNFNVSAGEPVLGFRSLDLGHNKDKGGHADTLANGTWTVPRTESMWWGPVKIFRQDPGWTRWPDVEPVRQEATYENYDPAGYPSG